MGMVWWALGFFVLARAHYLAFEFGRFDLGNMVQAVWSTVHGRPLEMTDGATGEQIVRLGAHVDPILVLFAPFWWLYPRPETLIVVYVAALASGVYPVVRLTLKYTESWLAAVLTGTWYLTFPWIVWIGLNEVNPMSLALPLLLYAICFLDAHRLKPFAVFAGLAVLTGELIGVTIAALGLWYAVRYRRVRTGTAIALAGVTWTVICLTLVIPAFNEGRSSRYYALFENVGGSPLGLVETIFTDPTAVVAELTSIADLRYLFLLVFPTALLFLGQAWLLIAAVPQLGVNLLSARPSAVSPSYHYMAPTIAILIAATVIALGRVHRRLREPVAGTLLAFGLVALFATAPRPGADAYLAPHRENDARVTALREAVALVPRSAPITVTNRVAGHLSARRVVNLFPELHRSEWVVLDTHDRSSDAEYIPLAVFGQHVKRLERNDAWVRVFEREGVRVYRRAP